MSAHGSSSSSAAAIAASLAPNGGGGTKRRFADPEYIAISEFLSSVGEVDDQDPHSSANSNNSINVASTSVHGSAVNLTGQPKRARSSASSAARRAAAQQQPQQQQHESSRQLVPAGKSRGASS